MWTTGDHRWPLPKHTSKYVPTKYHASWWYGVAAISRLLKIIGLVRAKEPYKRDYILQVRPIIFRSLLIVATPYHQLAVGSCHQKNYIGHSYHKREYILQKRSIIFRSLLIVATPYHQLAVGSCYQQNYIVHSYQRKFSKCGQTSCRQLTVGSCHL